MNPSNDSSGPTFLRLFCVALFSALVTAIVTWPQLLHPARVADHFDPYFSVWRLGHIARALGQWPIHLFDGNIFYPAKNTLAYSDATLLQGLLGAPLFWAGVSPTLIYNLLLYAGFVGSGVAMFVLAHHLTRATGPSLVAAAIFTMLPYRIEHLMHLELQWALFIPLTFWALHRTIETGRWRYALLTGLFGWLQFLSCIYYGVFLAMALVVFVPFLLLVEEHVPLRIFLPRLICAGILAGLLSLPYALPYVEASHAVGTRDVGQIAQFSAHPASYLATSALNRTWGWTADRFGAQELRLFPGAMALLLATASIRHSRRRVVLLYVVTTVVAVELSFGTNGFLYRWLLQHLPPLQGFRAIARFGMLAGSATAVMAALGIQALLTRIPEGSRWRRALVPMVLMVLAAEYSNRTVPLSRAISATPADAYKAIARAAEGAMVELPLPEIMPGFDPEYEAWSVWHGRPLLNGYSGFYPFAYLEAINNLKGFPDAHSIETLRSLNVRYVMVHRGFYEPEKYTELALEIGAAPALKLWGTYKDPISFADIFEVQP
ncbi:MAG: hypothetical protein ABL961_07965 [Vicinamibacterales bacterium]